MNTSNRNDSEVEIHPAVRSAYRDVASESPSQDLDRIVLREATRSVSRGGFTNRVPAWTRYAAFAAVAGLSLGVLLQLNLETPAVPAEQSFGEQRVPGATDDLTKAVETTGRRLRDLDRATEELLPANQPISGSATTPKPDRPGKSQDERYCDSETTGTAAAWWTCIEELNRRGERQAAQAEFELLRTEFPQFSPAK